MEVIGHRGAKGLVMENTLAGFEHALALGVDGVEFDVHASRDDVMMVHHDFDLNPQVTWDKRGLMASSPPLIKHLCAHELSRYGVGKDQFSLHQIPSLGQVLETLEHADPHETLALYVEIKTDPTRPHLSKPFALLVEGVLAALHESIYADQAHVLAFDWKVLDLVSKVSPHTSRCYLSDEETTQGRRRDLWLNTSARESIPLLVARAGGTRWAPHYTTLTRDLLNQAHDLGLAVVPWTVNTLPEMEKLILWGVDGIITDRPDILLRHLGRLDP